MADTKKIEKMGAWKPAILSWLLPLAGFTLAMISSRYPGSVANFFATLWAIVFCVGLILICFTFVKSRKHSGTLIHGVLGVGFYMLILILLYMFVFNA